MSEEKKNYYTEASRKASDRYKAKNIKRIPLDVQLEEYEQIKKAAEHAGLPVNTFIKSAIRRAIESQDA